MKVKQKAEFVSFLISLILIFGVVLVIVVRQVRDGANDFPVVNVEAEWTELKEKDGNFTLPVTIHNKGGRTANELRLRIRNGTEFFYHDVQYLSPRSPKKIYLLFKERPHQEAISLEPLLYSLD